MGDVQQLAEVEDQLFVKRQEMGGIYGPLDHRLRLMKRRDQLERKENVVRHPCLPAVFVARQCSRLVLTLTCKGTSNNKLVQRG